MCVPQQARAAFALLTDAVLGDDGLWGDVPTSPPRGGGAASRFARFARLEGVPLWR